MKDSVFQASSPFRHVTELSNVFTVNRLLFIYADGGPDHHLMYINVQLTLMCLFLKFDLDYLCAGRTAPHHSWRNPVEHLMSVLNRGLQCVGLARTEMGKVFEQEVRKCNSLLIYDST